VARYENRVVVVRGKLAPPATLRSGAVFELRILNDSDGAVPGVSFLTSHDIVTGLDDLPPNERSYSVRLTLRVGNKGGDGKTPVRVTRIDLIGRDDRLVRKTPPPHGGGAPFARLAKKPDKHRN